MSKKNQNKQPGGNRCYKKKNTIYKYNHEIETGGDFENSEKRESLEI